MKKLYYFGCIGSPGHYLYREGEITINNREFAIPGANENLLNSLDGTFTPKSTRQGIYNDCIVPPMRIVAWHDYTGDKRMGSNSALIGHGYENAEEMIDDAYKLFPNVMKRQTRPTKSSFVTLD